MACSRGSAALLAVALSVASAPRPASACAPAPAAGEPPIRTVREDALIVWDEQRHLEHFIRDAVFDTTSKSFGFLVPTPSRPTLADAESGITKALAALTVAEVVHRTTYVPFPLGCTALLFVRFPAKRELAAATASAGVEAVRVLEETRVAGLDAAVLEADDANALAAWLGAHGYEFRDALKRWVAPYLARKWTITAFKYARPDVASNGPLPPGEGVGPIASRAVRMTFATPEPVYPYREPDDAPDVPNRELHLFVLASSKLEGALGDARQRWGLPGIGTSQLEAALPDAKVPATLLDGVTLPSGLWVNEFVDRTSKRPPSDVAFIRARDPEPVRRPPIVIEHPTQVPVPYELPLVIGAVAWWRRRRRRARDTVTP